MNITARQLLTDFGRTDKLVDMARSGQIAAQDALEQIRHQLGYQAIQSFYGVLSCAAPLPWRARRSPPSRRPSA